MKRTCIYGALVLLLLTGCGNPTSSSLESLPVSVDTRTPKEKVLAVCDEIIKDLETETLFSSTQTLSGTLTIENLDSSTSIIKQDKFTLENFVIENRSEITENNENDKMYFSLKGNYTQKHIEQYSIEPTEEAIPLKNYEDSGVFDEKILTISDDFYCDLSSYFSFLFTDEQIAQSPELTFTQSNVFDLVEEAMEEAMPEFDSSTIEIPSINPNELLNEFLNEESHFYEYLVYSDKDGLSLTLDLKAHDFNTLIDDLYTESNPESTIPVSTIINMESGSVKLIFTFGQNTIESMDLVINGKFNLFADQFVVNTNLNGKAIVNEINEFTGIENYESYLKFEDAGINFKEILSELLGNIEFDQELVENQ